MKEIKRDFYLNQLIKKDGMKGIIDYDNKSAMHFISVIRLPDTDKRLHHEIYLSDLRKCDVSKLKTVIRHPIKKK